ncbi:hypothetical protein I3843_08G003300 [Carya illinoinensis]|nr:hypothetical protein I3843_08G003300 [Carya illinoinensis]
MDAPPANDFCSVCHSNFKIPCQANCSHWFCALHPCKCPLCRRQITLLVPGEASLSQRQDPEVAEILGKVQTYNRLFGGHTNGLFQGPCRVVHFELTSERCFSWDRECRIFHFSFEGCYEN